MISNYPKATKHTDTEGCCTAKIKVALLFSDGATKKKTSIP